VLQLADSIKTCSTLDPCHNRFFRGFFRFVGNAQCERNDSIFSALQLKEKRRKEPNRSGKKARVNKFIMNVAWSPGAFRNSSQVGTLEQQLDGLVHSGSLLRISSSAPVAVDMATLQQLLLALARKIDSNDLYLQQHRGALEAMGAAVAANHGQFRDMPQLQQECQRLRTGLDNMNQYIQQSNQRMDGLAPWLAARRAQAAYQQQQDEAARLAMMRVMHEQAIRDVFVPPPQPTPTPVPQGIPLIGVDVTEYDSGLCIVQVLPQSPAGRQDLRQGDVITAVDGRRLRKNEFADYIHTRYRGQQVRISFTRGPNSTWVDVTL